MDASPQRASDFRNACHNFFNHPQINLLLTGTIAVIGGYFAFVSIFHRWAFFPFEMSPDATHKDWALIASAVFVLYIISLIAAKVADLAWVKPALGPIIFGIMIRNITHFEHLNIFDSDLDLTLRYFALSLLLIRCGMLFNAELIAENWFLPVSLSILAALVEVTAIILSAHFIFGIPLFSSFVLGFLLAATSCSSLLPTMRHFQEMNQGSEKSIPAFILTSSALDNILCICASTILMTIQFSEGSVIPTIFIIIGESALALIVGAVMGALLWVFPRRQDSHKHFARALCLLVVAFAFVFGAARINVLFAGMIATLTMTIVAQRFWRADYDSDTVDDDDTIEARWFGRLWKIFAEPLVFFLLGAQLHFAYLTWGIFFSGLAIVAIGVAFRCVATFLLTFCNQLNISEKLFTVFCGVPKGSVQAALGSTFTTLLLTVPSLAPHVPLVGACLVCSAAIAGSFGHICVRVFGPFLLNYDFPETVHISNPNHNSYVETVKVDENPDNLVTFKQYKTMTQTTTSSRPERRPYEF